MDMYWVVDLLIEYFTNIYIHNMLIDDANIQKKPNVI